MIGIFAELPVALLAFARRRARELGRRHRRPDAVPAHRSRTTCSAACSASLEGLLLGAIGLGGLAAPLCIALIGTKPSLLVAGHRCSRCATLLVAGGWRAIDRTTAAPAHTALLRGVPLLGVLPEPVLEFLATSAVPSTARAGEAIVREGEVGDRFYVIESGEVEILGRTFGPGESFGRSRSCATCRAPRP